MTKYSWRIYNARNVATVVPIGETSDQTGTKVKPGKVKLYICKSRSYIQDVVESGVNNDRGDHFPRQEHMKDEGRVTFRPFRYTHRLQETAVFVKDEKCSTLYLSQ